MLPSCAARQRRIWLIAGACLTLVLLSVLALTAPWWGTWLLWQPSRTSFVTDSPRLDADGEVNSTRMVVPSIIHQTWKTEVIPEKWVAARQACMDLHPDYEFRLWTDETARELIATELPELLHTYDSYIYGIERADAIRYAILYLYGGFYIDLDIECRQPLDFLRSYPFVMPQTRPVGFSNDFLAAAPGHPFVWQLLAALPRWNLWLLSKYPTVMFSTGPMFVTLQASFYRARRSLWVLPDGLYGKYVPTGESLFAHLFGSSWHGEDAKSVLWLAHHPAVLLAVSALAAITCALYLWQRSCARSKAGQAQSDVESAALKMC